MLIKELAEKYKLSENDFWELPQKRGCWIISHDTCEKIASIEQISLVKIEVLNSERDFARFLVTMKKDDRIITSIGEAELIDGKKLEKKFRKGYDILKGNCESQYIGCMAEKRGIDRCILKLIDAYQYGVYSDSESDDFKKNIKNEAMTISNSDKIISQIQDTFNAPPSLWGKFNDLCKTKKDQIKNQDLINKCSEMYERYNNGDVITNDELQKLMDEMYERYNNGDVITNDDDSLIPF